MVLLAMVKHENVVNRVAWGGQGLLYSCANDRQVRAWRFNANRQLVGEPTHIHGHWVCEVAVNSETALKSGFTRIEDRDGSREA